jgi:hypothetical protein
MVRDRGMWRSKRAMKLVRRQMREQYCANMCVCSIRVWTQMSIRGRVKAPLQKVDVGGCSIASFKSSGGRFHVTAAVLRSGTWEW